MTKRYGSILLSTILSIISIGTTFTQKYLDVQLIGQQNTQWCWAASAEMVMDFHGTAIMQCSLSEQLRLIKGDPTLVCCGINCQSGLCNNNIPFSRRGGAVHPQYFDMIFANNTYYSFEDVNTQLMDGQAIRTHIDACQPFLVFLNKLNTTVYHTFYNHVVTIKGYTELVDTLFVLANDPQRGSFSANCDGCEFLLPSYIFSRPTQELNSALEMVTSIYPQGEPPCDTTCQSFVETTPLIEAVDDNPDLFQLLADYSTGGVLTNSDYNNMLNDTRAAFCQNNWQYYFMGQTGVHLIKGLVAYQATPPLTILFEQANSTWSIKGITFAACTPVVCSLARPIANSPTQDSIVMDANGIEIVEFLPEFHQFYRVEYKGATYMSPVSIHQMKDSPFKEAFYPERKVLQYMRDLEKSWEEEETGKKVKCEWFRRLFRWKKSNQLNKFK